MLSRANVSENDVVLITGASGGVGSALIQLAKRRGAQVVGIASEAKHASLKALGADALLPRNYTDLALALKEAIGRDNVTVVADIVGGECFNSIISVLQAGGRYTCSGAIAGPIVTFDLRTFYLNDLTFTGSTVVEPRIFQDLIEYLEKEEIRPMLAASLPLENLHEAQTMFIDKKHVGNIVVTMG